MHMSARAALPSRSSPSLLVALLLPSLSFPAFAQLSNEHLSLPPCLLAEREEEELSLCGGLFTISIAEEDRPRPLRALTAIVLTGCFACHWLFASRFPITNSNKQNTIGGADPQASGLWGRAGSS